MNLIYRKMMEIVIRNDYFMTGLDASDNSIWPDDYNIRDEIEIVPTPECWQLLQNHRIRFINTPAGFELWVQVEDSVLSPSDFQSFIYLEATSKFNFFMRLKNPNFVNYSNLRLNGEGDFIYYFNNRIGNFHNNISFLSVPLPVYDNLYPGESQYQLGDLIFDTGSIYEARQNVSPPFSASPLNPAKWQQLTVDDAQYVTIQDRVHRQGPTFTYTRNNSFPGETIQFTLFDLAGNAVPLGNIPNTQQPQSIYQTSTNGQNKVFHRLNFGGISPGRFRLQISGLVAEPDNVFYLLNPLHHRDVFGVIELFADISTANYRLVEYLPASPSDPRESVLRENTFEIRFKNRTTFWRYLLRNGNPLTTGGASPQPVQPRRELTRHYSGFSFPEVENLLPDPKVDMIYPERDTTNTELIEAIYSEIYLNET